MKWIAEFMDTPAKVHEDSTNGMVKDIFLLELRELNRALTAFNMLAPPADFFFKVPVFNSRFGRRA